MKSKEAKLIIRNDSDPEIYKWATNLKYGTFPKLVIEILRWYERNGLLVRGGVNHPDILPPKIPLNEVSLDAETLQKILFLVKENNQLLKSGEFVVPTENKSISEINEPAVTVIEDHQELSNIESIEVIEEDNDYENSDAQMPSIPMPFKIYK